MVQKLIVMQGVPGSGKSRKAKELQEEIGPDAEICSTDDFFIIEGVYCFDPNRLAENHAMNQNRAKALMTQGKTVIVDNTNIRARDCRAYVEHAFRLGIEIAFIPVRGSFPNTHGVPDCVIKRMLENMEELTLTNVLS